MDTPAPDSNLCATKAADLAEQAALLRRRVMNTDRPTRRLARTPTFAAHCLTISLDIATERGSAVVITVHAWQLSVTESLHSRHKKAVSMSYIQKLHLRERLVGPILVSFSLGLMIAGAVMVRW
jgi:hypothetical protein